MGDTVNERALELVGVCWPGAEARTDEPGRWRGRGWRAAVSAVVGGSRRDVVAGRGGTEAEAWVRAMDLARAHAEAFLRRLDREAARRGRPADVVEHRRQVIHCLNAGSDPYAPPPGFRHSLEGAEGGA